MKDKRLVNEVGSIHIRDGFYANSETGWIPVNKDGFILGPGNIVFKPKKNDTDKYTEFRGIHTHRIVALTFLPKPDNFNVHVVNHKDGNKQNNSLDNLEWVTPSENSIHAYSTGLRKDNKIIYAKNIDTGEEILFYSLQECARYFKVNGATIHSYLNRNRLRPFRMYWELRYENQGYVGFTKDDVIPIIENGSNRLVIAIPVDKKDKSIIFSNLQCAALYFNIGKSKLGWYLGYNGSVKDGKRANEYNGFCFHYLRDIINKRKNTESLINKSLLVLEDYKFNTSPNNRTPSRLKITNLKNGDFEIWKSLDEYCEVKGILKNTLEKRLNKNSYIIDGYLYEYLEKTKQYKDIRVASN